MCSDEDAESERRYRQLTRTSPAPINLFDASGEIIWGNDAVVDLLGLDSRDRLVGRSIFEFVHSDDRYTAERELAAVVENKVAAGPTPMTLRQDDGDVRRIRVSTAPGRYDGRDIGQAVIIDVTELDAVRRDLEAERQFVEDALNTLQDVFYVVDPGGELERWNDALLEISGYEESEVREMDVEDFFVERDTRRVSESIATVFAKGEDVLEATVRTKHGTEIPFEFRKRRLTDDGDVVGLAGIGRDVSARDVRDQHLRAVDHLLRHNLRNHLNVVRGASEHLETATDETAAEHVARIDSAAERLLSIFRSHHRIVELLTAQEPPEPVDVVAVVDSIVAPLEESYPAATITCDLPDAATASAVPQLGRAVSELVDNAIEHTDDTNPAVEIVVTSTASTVSIRVRDEGPSIPENEISFVTHPDAMKPTVHPTRLGLWFVHLVARESGGALAVDRTESVGNVVTIELLTPQTQWTT